ncbi:MAG: hypothetical protein JNK14_05605 [Chitinophagaceae bacterium]|nr:hypothetical protein [Chitinophagaceae bacterium]
MKGLIVYKGKYGATRQYAAWLRDATGLPLVIADTCTREQVAQNDFIVCGSSIYIGRLLIRHWLKKNIHALQNKRIYLFIVCGTPAHEIQKLQSYLQASVPAELLHLCHVYYLPGRLVYNKLSWFDKLMLRMGARLSKDPEAKKGLSDYDAVKKEQLEELLSDIRKFTGREVKPELIEH